MSEKSHVTMTYEICKVTGEKFETGVAIQRNLRNTLDKETTTGWGISPKVKELLDDGYVAIVGCDASKSDIENNQITPAGAYRTGIVIYMRRKVFDELCSIQPSDEGIVFADDKVIDMLKEMNHTVI